MINLFDLDDIVSNIKELSNHNFIKVFEKNAPSGKKLVWLQIEGIMTPKNFEKFKLFIEKLRPQSESEQDTDTVNEMLRDNLVQLTY